MKSWVLQTKKTEKHLLVEVGHARVVVVILEKVAGKENLVLNIFQKKEMVEESNLHDIGHRTDRYKRATEKILTGMNKSLLKKIKKITVVFDTPWGGSFWKDTLETDSKPIKYTKAVHEKIKKRALEEYGSVSVSSRANHRQSLLGLTPIHEKLNGYYFQEPMGKRAESISVTFQYDLASEEMRSVVSNSIRKVLPHHKIEETTRDALLYRMMQSFPQKGRGSSIFIFADDLRTSILFRGSDGSVEKKVIQVGSETLIERIKQVFTKNYLQSQHLLSLFLKGSLERSLHNEIMEEKNKVSSVWSSQLSQVVGHMVKNNELPERVIYTLSDSFLGIIERSVLESAMRKVLISEKNTTFMDFRDNTLVIDAPGFVSDEVVYLYVGGFYNK